ncbi:MAG: efflux RND transporter periplasmic adaptor subunit [Holosporaceae bacterium]|nr:efflux RND transporter periplasmic adaptor subunit [Holosporaceae bacterium]
METQIAKKSDIKYEINLIGTVRPKKYCTLMAKAAGTINILIQSGSNVKRGEIIAKIENSDIDKTYDLSISAEHIAKDQYERTLLLTKRGVSSKKDAENAYQGLIIAEKDLARARIEQENTLVRAPFDGILGAYKVRDGEQVSINCPLASFYSRKQLIVEFEIPSQYVSKINPGQVVYTNGQLLKLTHVQKAIDEENHMCPACVELESDTELLIGASINVTLVVEEKQNTIVIPYSAVFIKKGKNFVYVVKDGRVASCEVTLGIKNKEKVEILDGLKEKDEIIIIGQDRLLEDMKIKIAEKKAEIK